MHRPSLLTQARAREVIHKAGRWPYWGNYQRFMTDAEYADTRALWIEASDTDGNLSFASIVHRIAGGRDPITGDALPDETHEGFSNRETWAAALQLDNDRRLQARALHIAREAIAAGVKPQDQGGPFLNPAHPADEIERQRTEWTRKAVADALERWLENMAEDTFDAAGSAMSVQRKDYAKMIQAIGSLWRVEWRELADHFITKAREIGSA